MRVSFLLPLAAAFLVGLAGCRDDSKEQARSTDNGRAGQGNDDAKRDGNQQPGPEKPLQATEGAQTVQPRNSLDLSCISSDFFAALIFHPQRIAKSPLLAPLLEDETVAGRIQQVGINPAEVQRLILLLPAPKEGRPGPALDLVTIIARFAKPIDARQRLLDFRTSMRPDLKGDLIEKQYAGKTCYKFDEMMLMVAHVLDERTIVVTDERLVDGVLSDEQAASPLRDRVGRVDLDNDAILVVSFEPVREMIKEFTAEMQEEVPPLLAPFAAVPNQLKAATLTVNLAGQIPLNLALEANDPPSAEKVGGLAQNGLQMAKGMLAAMREVLAEERREQLEPAIRLTEEALDGIGIVRKGENIVLTLTRPESLDEIGPRVIAQALGAARKSQERVIRLNHLEQIAVAMQGYYEMRGTFPAAASRDADGKPLLSWRVALLPWLEQTVVHEKFHMDEPWDSPHNLTLLEHIPDVYRCKGADAGKTSIMVFVGEGTPFGGDQGPRDADIRDGLSNTIMFVEAGDDKAVPWTKPQDLPFDLDDPNAALGNVLREGFPATFFDGSLHLISGDVDAEVLKHLIQHRDGQVVDHDSY